MRSKTIMTALVAALALQACSSKPREFRPVLQAAPADPAAYEAAEAECRDALAAKLGAEGRLSSGGAGAAAGAATAAGGAAVASGTAGWGGLAVMGATVLLAPVAIVGGAWGVAKSKKLKKEKAVQAAAAECLAERGFTVARWERAPRKAR
ncbi:MAG TPA: hypothetical protein VNT77_06820 [Allosphingosinicella sp.]|nr:hypothetical protein [Allosphingosinicella sp.]